MTVHQQLTYPPSAPVVLTEAGDLQVCRLVPAPAERIWSYLTDSDLRGQWLASGDMDLTPGSAFELLWRNDQLTSPPGLRPDGFPGEHSNGNVLIAAETNRRLSFEFATYGTVTFELEPSRSEVMITLTHSSVPADPAFQLMLSASWHNHIDLLVARVTGVTPIEPYWDKMARLQAEYRQRFAA